MTSDPIRLLDDPAVASSLRDDLAQAASAQVTGLDLAGGLSALGQATAASPSVAGTSLATKLGVGAVLCGGAVALWLALGGEPSPAAVAPATGPLAAAAQPERGADPAQEVAAANLEPAATPSLDPAASPPVPVEPVGLEPGANESAPGENDQSEEPTTAHADASHDGHTHRHETHERAHGSSDDGEDGENDQPAADDVLREARLVAQARSKLGHEPAAALALTEDAEREFPRGQLIEERRAIAIRALLALGRADEARRRAEPFLATYGRGAHAAAVRRDLAQAQTTQPTPQPTTSDPTRP